MKKSVHIFRIDHTEKVYCILEIQNWLESDEFIYITLVDTKSGVTRRVEDFPTDKYADNFYVLLKDLDADTNYKCAINIRDKDGITHELLPKEFSTQGKI